MRIVAATSNKHKLKEICAVLSEHEILSQEEAGFFGDVEETGTTFQENALIKARTVCRATGMPSLADDSGLCVNALGGAPGVYSARYSGQGTMGNRALLLKNLEGVSDRSAYFCCALALVFPDGREYTTEGKTYGRILEEAQGENGFGYDPLFWSDDLKQSFAVVSECDKNAVSHRGRALCELKKILGAL